MQLSLSLSLFPVPKSAPLGEDKGSLGIQSSHLLSRCAPGPEKLSIYKIHQNIDLLGELVNYAIAEHIENAGVHSGDASLLLPAQRLFVETHRRVKSISQKLCHLEWYFHRENGGTLLMVP